MTRVELHFAKIKQIYNDHKIWSMYVRGKLYIVYNILHCCEYRIYMVNQCTLIIQPMVLLIYLTFRVVQNIAGAFKASIFGFSSENGG